MSAIFGNRNGVVVCCRRVIHAGDGDGGGVLRGGCAVRDIIGDNHIDALTGTQGVEQGRVNSQRVVANRSNTIGQGKRVAVAINCGNGWRAGNRQRVAIRVGLTAQQIKPERRVILGLAHGQRVTGRRIIHAGDGDGGGVGHGICAVRHIIAHGDINAFALSQLIQKRRVDSEVVAVNRGCAFGQCINIAIRIGRGDGRRAAY